MREVALETFEFLKEMPWPSTIDNIEKMLTEKLPEELERLLNLIFSGNEPNTEKCERKKRFVNSIGQDVCRGVSQGQWKLSKHILICVTLRHRYQLTIILNRLCQCESYSFGLGLEAAMTKPINEADTYLTPQILTGKNSLIFHSKWDNLKKILANVTERNVVNSLAGIILEEQGKETTSSAKQPRPMLNRSKERSLKPDQPTALSPKVISTKRFQCFQKQQHYDPHLLMRQNTHYAQRSLLCGSYAGKLSFNNNSCESNQTLLHDVFQYAKCASSGLSHF